MAASAKDLYLSDGPTVRIFRLDSGREVGEFRNPSGGFLSSPTVIRDGLTVVADFGAVYAVQAQGRELWRLPLGGGGIDGQFSAIRAPAVGADGTIFVTGLDGNLHALTHSGKELWTKEVGVYSARATAMPLAVSKDLLLLDAKKSETAPPTLIGFGLSASGAQERFSADLGIDVSGLVAGARVGIVATSYTETASQRGASRIVGLDAMGKRLWTLERGRHEQILAADADGQLLTASRDAAGKDSGSTLELRTSNGIEKTSVQLGGGIRFGMLGSDGMVYAISCADDNVRVHQLDAQLKPRASLPLGPGCPNGATLDTKGRILLARRLPAVSRPDHRHTGEVWAIKTSSPSVAQGTWSVPRGDPRGTARY